jgi:hypothetical protein
MEAFDVVGGRIAAVDSVLPVVAELDADGSLISVWQWTLDPRLRGRPTAKDVVLTDAHVVVASPAAGGIVRIDRRTGEESLIQLDEDIGWLIRDAERVWAVADPDRPGAYEAFLASPDRRPVVWEQPTHEDMERFRSRTVGWFVGLPGEDGELTPLADANDPMPTAEDWRDDDDDEAEHIGPPTPLWAVNDDRAVRIQLDGDLSALGAGNGWVVAVCQLPSDPLIKAVQPGGYLSYVRPGTVLVGDGQSVTPVGTVAESSGTVWIEGQHAWLLGFNRELDDEQFEVRRLDMETGLMSEPFVTASEVVAVVRGQLITVGRGDEHSHVEDRADRADASTSTVRVSAPGSEAAREIGTPRLEDQVAVDGSMAWFRVAGACELVGVDVELGTVRRVPVEVDCRDFLPAVSVPENLDASAFESEQLEGLRAAFFGGWRSESGDQREFIDGVTFDSVELDGSFPHTAVVALFHAADRDGIQFGRRWSLYDDLGNPQQLEYADIHLMEDIEAGYGLPRREDCLPGDDGIVWF